MNICEHLTATALAVPDNPALVFEGKTYSYADLNARSAVAAEHLRSVQVKKGDRVALMLPNVPAFAVWYYGALRVGAVAVSLSSRLTADEVNFLADDCQAVALVASSPAFDQVRTTLPACVASAFAVDDAGEIQEQRPDDKTVNGARQRPASAASSPPWVDCEPDEPALILYTSGTTGFAKGATLSHANVRSNVCAFNHLCGMRPEDRILLSVPLFHCFGQNALLNSGLHAGATLILQRQFDLAETVDLIREHAVTQLYGVPMMFQLWHDRCRVEDLASVNYCFSAAAKLPLQVGEHWRRKFGQPIFEGYGLTETSPFSSYNHRLNFVPGSIGAPIDGVEMRIVDEETGEARSAGELGEIAIRGPNVMLGYWNRPEDTAAAIRNGWFHSGDIGRVDEQGCFYIVDRVKDMIAIGGLKVYPAEVERVLQDHPLVRESAVVGVPDEVFGERVVAFVVLRDMDDTDGMDNASALNDLASQIRKRLANYKVPRQLVPVDELPRNPSGKILKRQLREQFEQLARSSIDISSSSPANPDQGSASHAGEDGGQRDVDGRRQRQESVIPQSAVEAPSLRPATLKRELFATHASNRLAVATAFIQELVRAVLAVDELPDSDAKFLDLGMDSLMMVELSSQIQVELGDDAQVASTLVFDHPRISDLSRFVVATWEADDGIADAATKKNDSSQSRMATRELQDEIEAMTEEEAMDALMREIEE